MNSSDKNAGSLREINIKHSEENQDTDMLPKQSVRSRQGNIVEWDQNEELWNEWKREVESELSVQSTKETPVSAPLAREVKKEIPKFEPEKEKSENILKNKVSGRDDWAVDLAIKERSLDKEGTVDYGTVLHKQEMLKIKTKEFMSKLQEMFRMKVELFNQSRRDPSHHIHIYKVSKSDEDFMLYRNSVKLVVSGREVGKIVFAFNQFLGQVFHNQQQPIVELNAQWGVFDQLMWSYKGEKVDTENIVRYFLTQFAQQSYK